MDIDDLRSYLVIAQVSNLRAAADVLHQTPSALSKAVRRLEESLATALFDRVGKSLRLNAAGEHLVSRARALVEMADATAAEFRHRAAPRQFRLAGPSILQSVFGAQVAQVLSTQASTARITLASSFEDAAMASVGAGDADFALVTTSAIANSMPANVTTARLGQVRMQLVVGADHPLSRRRSKVSVERLLEHDFACVDRSPFCGLPRGARSDGWRDDRFPRRIRYWVDDLQTLLAIVQRGLAIAYVPEFAVANAGLKRLSVVDCPFECVEDVHLAFRTGQHPGAVADLRTR